MTASLKLLADLIAERVVSKLQSSGCVASESAYYSSLALPPDVPTRRRFNNVAKTIPGAVKRGQVWIVDRAAWDSAREGGA